MRLPIAATAALVLAAASGGSAQAFDKTLHGRSTANIQVPNLCVKHPVLCRPQTPPQVSIGHDAPKKSDFLINPGKPTPPPRRP
ncbi:MAG: hypothetical protein ACRCTI_17260 [Beijerinckiaceae bacterium]